MHDYVVIIPESDLLVQVLKELLALTPNPNDVEVTDGETGRVIHARSWLADRWYGSIDNEAGTVPLAAFTNGTDPEPVKRKRGRPRKLVPATISEAPKPTSSAGAEASFRNFIDPGSTAPLREEW